LDQSGEIKADKVLFEVLVKNILENAIRYNPDDQSVSVAVEESPNDYLIRIRDHGPGIPEDELDKVTEPFYRTSQSRTRESGGFGLGLYLCKQIIEAHQGSMVIKNHEEQGIIVVLSIPKQHKEVNN
jgi:signal transduction histidine kinase